METYEIQAEAMITLGQGTQPETVLDAITTWSESLPDAIRAEVATLDAEGEQASLGDTVPADGPVRPDLILTLTGNDEDALLGVVTGLSLVLSPYVANDTRILGERRYQVLPGQGPVRLFYALSRLPDMSREDFQHYWLHTHAELGRRFIPPYSYIQAHADADLTDKLSHASGWSASMFDGVVAIHFPDLSAAQAQLAREDVTAIALEDERRFIDHERVLMGFFSVQRSLT